MKTIKIMSAVLLFGILQSCEQKEKLASFTVTNNLESERSFETLSLTPDFLKVEDLSNIGIRAKESGAFEVTQLVDTDGDGTMDELLFQPKVPANAKSIYEIVVNPEGEMPKAPEYCYSRFVPERTDDYTWENNRVAFRMYGPTAQKMVEDSIAGGTLSSGVDAWLKKVEYPVINKWYKKNDLKPGAYHEPSPEGLDNFHVGTGRGVGGLAVKMDTTFYMSKNYTDYKTITTGPLRTSFMLNFADWDVDGRNVEESMIVSLDLGSNLTKFDVNVIGPPTVMAGLSLHEKDGEVKGNKDNGWVSLWQPHADSELGTAIVAAKDTFVGHETYDTEAVDQSAAYAQLAVKDGQVVYYAGFGWKESGQFASVEEWEKYLSSFSEKINNPLTLAFNE